MSAIFGETLTFTQENGPDVRLVVFGDEFYARYETEDGYTVVDDSDLGLFCYAFLVNGEFVSSGIPLTKRPPAGVRRHFKESEMVRNAKFEKRYTLMTPPANPYQPTNTMLTFGPNNGLLEGRRVSEGSVRGLTILVQFQDIKSSTTSAEVEEMLNGQSYSGNGNFCSVRKYYHLMSNGKLDYTNEVVGPITLRHKRYYYTQNPLMEEALDAVAAMGIDFSRFDSNGEGIIDAMSFLYAGQTEYRDWLWPHNYTIDLEYNGVKTNFYMISSMGRSHSDLSIGTFCHESGYMLCRFPDIYDYGKRDGDFEKSAGIGRYCLMGSGNHNNSGRTPSPICAYLRDLVGWCDKKVMLNGLGEYQAAHSDYGTIMIFETNKINEYYLVENRSGLGLDAHLPSSGLAVYHCDTLGSNEWQGGTADKHYQCGILQADGHFDLENNRNRGDEGDLFQKVQGVALSHFTLPSSTLWDGSDSRLIISNIDEPGDKIGFVIGPTPSKDVVRGEASPALDIPDNDPSGASSTIAITESNVALKIKVNVDIVHTYIGDLKVELIAPSDERVILHNRSGGSRDNLIETYDSETYPALKALVGQPIQGNWTLWVTDLAGRDVGKLNRWVIEIELEAIAKAVSKESQPQLGIPDNDPTGVSDFIAVDEEGTLQKIIVGIDISHTYIGDLRVELFTPAGKQAILHNRTGFGRDNLVITYDSDSNTALSAFIGQPIQGNWILRVTDLAGKDVGKLNKWSLDLSYLG